MVLVLISWVIFASVDGQGGFGYFASMFGLSLGEVSGVPLINTTTMYLLRNYGLMLILCAVGATPVPAKAASALRGWLESREKSGTAWQILWSGAAMLMFIVCTAYLVDATYNPFLYFRF